MTVGSPPIRQVSARGPHFVLAVVVSTIVVLGAVFAAAAAGIAPKSPTYVSADPADQYLSSQTIGERAAER